MQRNIYLDIVKGIAIIFVVFGHCLQYGTMNYMDDQYYDYPLFIIIYSFHMPLFMLVSGYLFYGSINRHSTKYNFKTRFTSLLLPIISWNTINILILDTHALMRGNDISILNNAQSYLTATWFLWSIFWCSLIVLMVNHILKDNIAAYLLIGVVLLLLPNTYGISYHVFMYPYFLVGYLWNKYKLYRIFYSLPTSIRVSALIIIATLFVFLCMHFTKADYVYTSGTCIVGKADSALLNLNQLGIDIYRYVIGFVGSACVLMIVKLVYNIANVNLNNILASIGRRSIGIYVLSVPFINSYVLSKIPFRDSIDTGGVLWRQL